MPSDSAIWKQGMRKRAGSADYTPPRSVEQEGHGHAAVAAARCEARAAEVRLHRVEHGRPRVVRLRPALQLARVDDERVREVAKGGDGACSHPRAAVNGYSIVFDDVKQCMTSSNTWACP